MGYTLKTAQYVNDFQCICGKCNVNCCDFGWDILWLDEEVDFLKTAPLDEGLKQLVYNSFEKLDDTKYKMKLLPDGCCPFHDQSDGLCRIQKNVGEKYLSTVCKNYPTCGTENNKIITKTRYLSCPAVFDLITKEEKACDVYIYKKDYQPDSQYIYQSDTFDDVKKLPVLKYRNQLFDFFYKILSNKKRDIHTSLIIGTLAAQTLSKLEKSSPDRILEGISALSKQIDSPAIAKSLSDIQPNYQVKLGVVQCMLDNTSAGTKIESFLSSIRYKNKDNISSVDIPIYVENLKKFYITFGSKPFIMNNIIRCLFLSEQMPFASKDYGIFDNYAFFCAASASIDFFAAAAAACSENEKDMLEKFRTMVCLASHPLCHNRERVKMIVDYLKEINCYSAGYLALIVK